MTQRLRLIVNPISGTRSGQAKQSLAAQLEAKLREAGFDVDTVFTTGSGDATRLARQAIEHRFDGVIACGGDGTINETATAMIDAPIPMGIIPAGSGNGLARHMAIPMEPLDAAGVIAARNITDCDFGSVNSRPFFCTFGVGFDAAVSDRFAAASTRGKFSYIRSAVEEFAHYHTDHYIIDIDGRHLERDAFLIAVCNASQYGNNAYIAPTASITDGVLDVIIINKASRLRTFLLGFDLMAGLIADNNIIETFQVRDVRIQRSAAGPAHLDGEPVSLGVDLDIHCNHSRLKLFTSPDKSPFKPLITPAESLISDLSGTITHLFR